MPSNPEPAWGAGQRVDRQPSSLSSTGITPVIATGVFVRLLEAHFADPANIRNSQLRAFLWADSDTDIDPLTTRINILPGYKYDTRLLEQSPSVFVKRDECMAAKFNLAGKATTHLEQNGNYRGENHLRVIRGAHSILCCAKGALNSETIAEEVFYRMLEYSPVIQDDLKFGDFEVKSMAPAVKMEDDKDYFVTQVTLVWQIVHSWVLQPIAPILKKVSSSVNIL